MLGPVVVKMTTISQKLLRANAGMKSASFQRVLSCATRRGKGETRS